MCSSTQSAPGADFKPKTFDVQWRPVVLENRSRGANAVLQVAAPYALHLNFVSWRRPGGRAGVRPAVRAPAGPAAGRPRRVGHRADSVRIHPYIHIHTYPIPSYPFYVSTSSSKTLFRLVGFESESASR